jgi:DNA-directed RNA polymerase specialized sigma24 family protein
MNGIPAEQLYDALDTLRRASAISAEAMRAEHDAWDTIARHVEQLCPREPDVAQDALVTVVRSISRFRGSSAGEALQWLGSIVRSRRLDAAAKRSRDPVTLALRAKGAREDDDRVDPLESVAPFDGPGAAGATAEGVEVEALRADLERVRELVFGVLATQLREASIAPHRALVRERQARVCWLSIVERAGSDAILASLGPDAPTRATLYKWVERGRPTLLAALRHARRAVTVDPHAQGPMDQEPGLQGVLLALEARVAARRADAGLERPARTGRGAPPI